MAATIYQREPGPHGDLARSSIVKTVGNDLGKAILETHMGVEKDRGLPQESPDQELGHMCVEKDRGLPQESPDQELDPCEGLRQGLVESMRLLVPR